MVTVTELIKEINDTRHSSDGMTYDTKSQKDEVAVMKAMLNDRQYRVDVYGPSGVEGSFCPAECIRETMSSIISNTTGIGSTEARHLMDNYEIKSTEARNMIDLSKEFINTYMHTGRKLPLGGREASNVSLIRKPIPPGIVKFPVKVGEDKTGKAIYESEETYVAGYDSIKVYNSCPVWVKAKAKKEQQRK